MAFSFIQITDHHLTASDAEYVKGFSTRYALRAVLRHIASNPAAQADFLVSTGDLVDRPSENGYRAVLEMLGAPGSSSTAGSSSAAGSPSAAGSSSAAPGPIPITAEGLREVPLYLLPGNHDDRDLFYRCLFPQAPPAPLMNAAFMHQGVQFICLDWGPRTKAAAHPQMLDFLARSLAAGAPSIILSHYHVTTIGARWLDAFIADDVCRFWDVVAGKNVLGVFCGHLHITYEQVVQGIPVFGLRSTTYSFALQDEPQAILAPPHYRLVTVEESGLETQIFEVPL